MARGGAGICLRGRTGGAKRHVCTAPLRKRGAPERSAPSGPEPLGDSAPPAGPGRRGRGTEAQGPKQREGGQVMAHRGDAIVLLTLLLLGGALLVNGRGDVLGRAQERRDGYVDLFDKHSNRLGWGRVNRDGSLELFDRNSDRLGTSGRDRRVIRLERP